MEVLIDADARYPMASVFKIPILVEALARVGEGRQALDTRVGLRAEDRVPPSGVLVTLEPGLRPTLKDLLMLMIVQSDNMATDAVLGLIDLESVERRMRALSLPRFRWGLLRSVKDLRNGPCRSATTGPHKSFWSVRTVELGSCDRLIRWPFGKNTPSQQAPTEPTTLP